MGKSCLAALVRQARQDLSITASGGEAKARKNGMRKWSLPSNNHKGGGATANEHQWRRELEKSGANRRRE